MKMNKLLLYVIGLLLIAVTAGADSERIMMERSTQTLGSSAAYTSGTYEAVSYKYLVVTVTADQNSATDGVKIEQSCDDDCDTAPSPSFQYVSEWTYTAGATDNQYVAELNCKCARVRYVNGAAAQGSFSITAYLKLN